MYNNSDDYFQRGSFSQLVGNPIAAVSTLGYCFKSVLKSLLKVFVLSIALSQYNIHVRAAYNLLGIGFCVIQSFDIVAGVCGITGIMRFHTRP